MNGEAPWHQTHWDWHVALNFITGGAGSGLLVVAGLAALGGAPLALPALVAVLLAGAGLAQVSLHLGRPLRAFNVLRNPNSSWMTREAMVAGPMLLAGLLATGFDAWPLGLLAAVPAALFLWCQARMLEASKGIPAWRDRSIVPLITLSGLAEGCGLYLLLLVLVGAPAVPAGLLLVALVAGRLVTWRRYQRALQGAAPKAALQALARAEGAVLGLGHVAPLLLAVTGLYVGAARAELLGLAGLLAAAGGGWMKYVIVLRAGYNQGFAIEHSPARGASAGAPGHRPGW